VNGTTTQQQPNVWASIIDRGLEGWLTYLNRPPASQLPALNPFGMPASTTAAEVQNLNAQLQQQAATTRMLMLVGGAALLFVVLNK